MKKAFLFTFFIIFAVQGVTETLSTLYGIFEIDEPVLIELINCPAVQRLKHINQYGIDYFTKKNYLYTRYEHSIGVMVLLKKFGAPLKEQIAGLLHDVSHTVFSHVSDFMHTLDLEGKDAYQDNIHLWYIMQTTIPDILSKYDIDVIEILHKNDGFHCLEQKLPDLCADRLEYILQGAYLEDRLTQNEITFILNRLVFRQNEWLFTDLEAAKRVGYASLYLTECCFAAPFSLLSYHLTAQMLQRALEVELMSPYDLHFGHDQRIWDLFCTTHDEVIKQHVGRIQAIDDHVSLGEEPKHDLFIRPKFRGVNPLVQHCGMITRLVEVDSQYEREYCRVKSKMAQGFYFELL